MKTKFRKLILMAREEQRISLTQSMQELGLLHIAQDHMDFPEETEALIHELNLVKGLIQFLEKETDPDKGQSSGKPMKVKDVIQHLRQMEGKGEEIHQEIERLEKKENHLASWGDYDFQKFQMLIEQGLSIFLCRADRKTFDKIARSRFAEVIEQQGAELYFVLITEQKDYTAGFEHFPLPIDSPSHLRDEIHKLKTQQSALKASIQEFVPYLSELRHYKTAIDDAMTLTKTQASFDEHYEGRVISISAWFPIQKEQEVLQFLEGEEVVWKIRDPNKEESVPVVLKNKKYPKLFEPITKIFELPNYYETDLTPFPAVFYPILFAYCLGDAGYGFVLAALMLAGYFSFLKSTRNIAILGIILGGVTMIIGLIKSGSIFGIGLLSDHPAGWIRQLSKLVVIPDDSSFIFNAFNVALMIGVIQILTGILISIYNHIIYKDYAHSIAPFAKLLIVSSLIWIFLADMQGVNALIVFGDLRIYMLVIGIILVIFFHDIELSVIRRVGSSFMPLFFIFTGVLGDILSYVRLFALGLASSVLGLVVNQIGLQIMEGGIISIIIGVLFLLFGHTLNFGIAALGSFVHPLRLTFVEFYGNVGFQGKGLVYRPFHKSKQTYHL
ncbi:MAG: V-type ATPase 116kDa subunit family protein [Cyclobacteriaceae bacterium]